MKQKISPSSLLTWISLTFMIAALGMLSVPMSITQSIHGICCELIKPGVSQTASLVNDFQGQTSPPMSENKLTDAGESKYRYDCRQELLAVYEAAERQNEKSSVNRLADRLFQLQFVNAQILSDKQSRLWRMGMLLNGGTSSAIREYDWVLSSDHPLIDIGEDYGIKSDQVIISGRHVIGQVVKVGRWTSIVRPVQDDQFRCPASLVRIDPDSEKPLFWQSSGSFHGSSQGRCQLQYVDQSIPVSSGDLVVVQYDQRDRDHPLVLGEVVEASLDESSSYWNIFVNPLSNLDQNRNVSVLTEVLNPLRFDGAN